MFNESELDFNRILIENRILTVVVAALAQRNNGKLEISAEEVEKNQGNVFQAQVNNGGITIIAGAPEPTPPKKELVH